MKCNKISRFLNGNFQLDKWEKMFKVPTEGRTTNIFLMRQRKQNEHDKLAICKHYFMKEVVTDEYLTLLKKLDSPYVEKFIDFFRIQIDSYTLEMILVENISKPGVDMPSYIPIECAFNDLKNGLEYIHAELKILHNDIKTDNIRFNGKNACLIDFEKSINLNDDKIDHNKVVCFDEYKHPKKWLDSTYFSLNIDYWAALCALYEIYEAKFLFEFLMNKYNLYNACILHYLPKYIKMLEQDIFNELEYFTFKSITSEEFVPKRLINYF